jgi:hypothetical protein
MDAENHYDSDSLGCPDQSSGPWIAFFLGCSCADFPPWPNASGQRALVARSALTNKDTAKASVPMEFASQPRLAKSWWFSAPTSEICAISVSPFEDSMKLSKGLTPIGRIGA